MIMNFKLFKLRVKIAYYFLTGKINRSIPQLELSHEGHDSRKVLFMFPLDEPSFRVAAYSFRNLGQSAKDLNDYTYLVKEEFNHLFTNRKGEIKLLKSSLKKPHKISTMSAVLNNLRSSEYDMVIDLNTEFHLDASRILSHIPARLKVGFCSNFSDLFYNIQLDVSKSGITENGYHKVHTMLEAL